MQPMLLLPLVVLSTAKVERIDLVDFGQVVKFSDGLKAEPLERGADGWEAWLGQTEPGKADSGTYMIAVQWEEPRDLAEVNLEFRHAIANREKIQVQYWQEGWPAGRPGAAQGHWQTVKIADWWAGDRDVTFVFAPFDQEQPGQGAPDLKYRRTRRLRFVIGKEAPPPVRYLRAYGPGRVATGAFELRADETAGKPALTATVDNGYIVQGTARSTTQSTLIDSLPRILSIRYAVVEPDSSDKTVVKLQGEGARREEFVPAEVFKSGRALSLKSVGVIVTAASQPAGK